jgi:hypothetical protein
MKEEINNALYQFEVTLVVNNHLAQDLIYFQSYKIDKELHMHFKSRKLEVKHLLHS